MNGRESEMGAILWVVPPKLVNTWIPIDLLSMKLGLVDIVLGMDWLACQTRILGNKKQIRIKDPKGETFDNSREKKTSKPISFSMMIKAIKCIQKVN